MSRRVLKTWAAVIAILWVFAMGAVASKTIREPGSEWCAWYMLIKYLLYMEDSSCSSVVIEPPITGVQPSSQAGKPLSETHYETLKFLDPWSSKKQA